MTNFGNLGLRVMFVLAVVVGLANLTEPSLRIVGTISVIGGLQGLVLTGIFELLFRQQERQNDQH